MEMKLQLPNPDDVSAEQWFAQMRIVLKAAEKMYQEMVANLKKEGSEEVPWIRFDLSEKLKEECVKGIPEVDEDMQSKLFIQVAHL